MMILPWLLLAYAITGRGGLAVSRHIDGTLSLGVVPKTGIDCAPPAILSLFLPYVSSKGEANSLTLGSLDTMVASLAADVYCKYVSRRLRPRGIT